ncbi:hypothetical protein Desca_2436 [Desulfotomaculum nigrificans CO-1-SRB]|uniref:Uncharacterized protein n=1 Tax=Desulfotomaculum nigrificans (strain DSM 14880 / VKM B-2319 / CO-1-SRB) TaxID=868595 RepID=F6B487_DESCC|nr:hypothetical protein [Desulfotomaculum nigrificans]AEF95264.1 hypothetical protein Desca_2436 [Desulfotomaculum nigrificans CO-1-SRB]
MRSNLYPAFIMESEDFELALPIAVQFAKNHDIPCRVLKEGDLYTICFEDRAVSRGIVYGHRYEKELDQTFSKYALTDVIYLSKDDFERGIVCDKE